MQAPAASLSLIVPNGELSALPASLTGLFTPCLLGWLELLLFSPSDMYPLPNFVNFNS